MAGPWEKYADAPADDAPWAKYGGSAPKKAAASEPPPVVGSSPQGGGDAGFFGNLFAGVTEPIAAMGSGMLAKPISDVAGLGAMTKEMISPTPGGGDPEGFKRHVQESLTYQPKNPTGQAVTDYNPLALLGKLLHAGAEGAGSAIAPPGSSSGREAVGHGVTEALEQLPGFAGIKAPPVAAAAGAGLKDLARGQMQSALKPILSQQETGKAARGIDTLLDQGINVTKGGAQKLQGKVDVLNNQISDLIKNSTAMVDKVEATQHVQGKVDQFMKQVDPLSDVAAIQSAYDRFMKHPLLPEVTPARTVESKIVDEKGKPFKTEIPASGTNKFPVQLAQEIKQGTHRQLGDKAYGELKGAEVEAQKTLNRGIKDVIAAAVPEVRPLNAVESNYLNGLSLVERRLMMSANKNPIGLGWLTTSPEKFALWMADRSELFKSLVARMLNTGSRAAGPIGAAGPPLGMAIGSQAQQQIPAPPQ